MAKIRVDRARSVLLVVDMQPDFMPGGALPTQAGDAVVAPTRALMEADLFGLYVATQDWHPPGHISFASSHPGHEPFETIELYGELQTLWPDHCVQDTPGAELHGDLPMAMADVIIRKATNPAVDSYSAFRNNVGPDGQRPPTGLAGYLQERGVRDVYLCGLARDFCAKWSTEDAVDAGFNVWLFWDLTSPVDPNSDAKVQRDLEQKGVRIISWEDVVD